MVAQGLRGSFPQLDLARWKGFPSSPRPKKGGKSGHLWIISLRKLFNSFAGYRQSVIGSEKDYRTSGLEVPFQVRRSARYFREVVINEPVIDRRGRFQPIGCGDYGHLDPAGGITRDE